MKQRSIFQQMIRRILMPLIVVALSAMILLPLFVVIVTGRQSSNEFKLVAKSINDKILQISSLGNELEKEGKIQSWFDDRIDNTDIYSGLYKISNSVEGKPYFLLSDLDGKKVVSYQPSEIQINGIKTLVNIRQMCEAQGEMILLSSSIQNGSGITFGKGIYKGEECVGYLVFSYYKSQIDTMLQGDNTILILNKQDRVLYSNKTQHKVLDRYETTFEIGSLVKTHGSWYLSSGSYLNIDGLQIYSLFGLSFIIKVIQAIMLFLVISVITVILVFKIMRKQYSKDTFAMIDEMFLSLANYDKVGELIPVGITNNNLSEHIDHYNSLLSKVQNLLEKNKLLTDETTIAQIKQLQMQFNPHFLFNTLASIQVMINRDTKKANMMIHRLAQMLRYSLRFVEENKVILNDDIEYLRDYLSLQKLRFEDYLEYSIDIEDGDFLVPKLILQPIIENSIIHGFLGDKVFELKIMVYHIMDDLIMVVKDNGLGMSRGRLNDIQEMLTRNSVDDSNIGLLNCHRRLKLMYGNSYGVSIDSLENKGTIVMLRCKAERRVND